MEYLYETHLHTDVGSVCGRLTPEDQVRRFHKYGYTGIFITDHFFNGNTTVPKGLGWSDSVDLLFLSYERAKTEGSLLGLDVFFGFESSFGRVDILTYGLEKEWLKLHPEIMDMSLCEYCKFARSEGGLVVHAHPFWEGSGTIETITLIPRCVDAVEVLNACRSNFENERASEYARNYDLAITAGSDLHSRRNRLCGVLSPARFSSSKDYCNAVRERLLTPVTVFDGRPDQLCE